MKRVITGLSLIVAFAATTSVQAQDERVLMNIGGDDVTVSEFLNIYNKNNTNNVVDKKTMDEYVDLFVNFKLKVKEAEALGMDTATKFSNELEGYRRQLAQPYLVDRDLNEQLIKEAYDRMNQDVAAYHILVRVDQNAAPGDTLKALKKLKELSKGVKTERDMQRVISVVKNDGDDNTIAEDLGYFTAFSMVYPFETAAYTTPVGSLSTPIRTRFGYHVVYVKDKRPARGEVRVSHILIKATDDRRDDASATAKERIDEIYKRLKEGESFDDLVKGYSEDKATANKGGQLPWFGTGRLTPEFEDAAFSLENNGDFSAPVQTSYGWHIIRRDDYRGIEPFDKVKNSIKKRIERDSRGQKGRTSLLKKLKEEYAITYNYKNRDLVNKLVNKDLLEGKWKPTVVGELDKAMMTIADNKYSNTSTNYTQQDYVDYLIRYQRKQPEGTLLSAVLKEQWDGFVNAMLIRFEDANLEAKYPDFKALMQEYHDGILLFDLMDDKVWSKAVKDSTGLQAYYEERKSEFMWGKRVDASIYVCADAAIAKQAMKLAKKRVKKGYTDAFILEEVNESNPLNLAIRSGIYTKEEDPYIDASPWEKGIHSVPSKSDKAVFVQVYKVMEPTPKSLDECRGLVTSAFQSHLEEEWIKELRGKYKFGVNEDVFNSIKK